MRRAHPSRPGLAEHCCLDVCVRICVIGNSGSGKSTLARVLAHELGLAHIELDSFFHQPDWQATPPDLFRRNVSAAQEAAENTTGGWVCDGNYMRHLTDLTVERADVIVCFQFSRVRVMRQLIRRTLRRTLLREELWNGNRERFRNMFRPKPEVNILRWAWTQHDNYTAKFAELRSHSTATWIDIRTAHDRDSAIDAVKAALA